MGQAPNNKFKHYYAYFPLDQAPSLIHSLSVDFLVDPETGIIQEIVTDQKYDPASMLETFGPPEKIPARASSIPKTGSSSYEIQLIYLQNGIQLNISGDTKTIHREEEDFTVVCLENIRQDSKDISLWSPDKQNPSEDLLPGSWTGNRFIDIEALTKLTKDQFYSWLEEKPANNCINIPMKFWY